jgi:PleD family two-component response regulator
MHKAPVILFVDSRESAGTAVALLEESGYKVIRVSGPVQTMQRITDDPPQLIILAPAFAAPGGGALLTDLRSDGILAHIPIVLFLAEGTLPESIDWLRVPCDDYLLEPCSPAELRARVALALARGQRDVNANPLTGLPGNVSIMREVERRLERSESFAVAYLDVDNFKSFNDKYGFARGDEVLRMTARILLNAVRTACPAHGYVGHVGGDDFLFITDALHIEHACKAVIENFDLIVPNFYDDDDRARGSIESIDRTGNPHTFPLMSCSIAVIDASGGRVRHLGDISARAVEVKHYAKEMPGSNYLVDRRKA